MESAFIRGLRLVSAEAGLGTTPVVTAVLDDDGDEILLRVAFGATESVMMQRAVARLSARHAGPSTRLGTELQVVEGRDVVFKGCRAVVLDGVERIMAQRKLAADALALVERLARLAADGPAAPEEAGAVETALGLRGGDASGRGKCCRQ